MVPPQPHLGCRCRCRYLEVLRVVRLLVGSITPRDCFILLCVRLGERVESRMFYLQGCWLELHECLHC